jgi:hypothetical protein
MLDGFYYFIIREVSCYAAFPIIPLHDFCKAEIFFRIRRVIVGLLRKKSFPLIGEIYLYNVDFYFTFENNLKGQT